jgi:hypothetical protein
VVPGIVFAGYKTPFTWTPSPRAGVTYALDGTACGRASFSRYAGRLGTVGVLNRLDGRIGDLSLDRPQRRSLRAGE